MKKRIIGLIATVTTTFIVAGCTQGSNTVTESFQTEGFIKSEISSDDIKQLIEDTINSSNASSFCENPEDWNDIFKQTLIEFSKIENWNTKQLSENTYAAKSEGETYTLGLIKKDDKLLYSSNILKSVLCNTCAGAGQIVNGGTTCGICGGTGQVYIPNAYYDATLGWQGQWQICSGCSGLGKTGATTEICHTCHGYGYDF